MEKLKEENEQLMLINGRLVRRINRRERIASELLKLQKEYKELKKKVALLEIKS
tara:strand:- start:271 stop:432 length:162 start_codon:yes stop_codon:yes gene_type:complete